MTAASFSVAETPVGTLAGHSITLAGAGTFRHAKEELSDPLSEIKGTQADVMKFSSARYTARNEEGLHSSTYKLNPKRKFNGFIVCFEGKDARVAVVNKGSVRQFRFPKEKLVRREITELNQPFEMAEFELNLDGSKELVYTFKSLARRSDRRRRAISLEPEDRAELSFILASRKNADG